MRKKFRTSWNLVSNYMIKHVLLCIVGFVTASCILVSWGVYWVERSNPHANIKSYFDSLWWGIVTMLTIGYGDRYPVTFSGRILAFVLMTAGVTAVGILTAKVSSYFLEKALNERRGFVDEHLLKDHLVVCGWKGKMHNFLSHILESNPGLRSSSIVLVNDAPDEALSALMDNAHMRHLKVVKGEFYSEGTLKRAAPHRARKVLILADATPDAEGKIPSVTEADARTIMTAMTLSHIARGVPVVAEILDAAMDEYLRLAHVNDIIYTRDYSRLLMAKASNGTGIPNIVKELLNPHGSHCLTTREIPTVCFDQSFADAREIFRTQWPDANVLGILENSGNSHSVKDLALRRAQKTPDIRQLVENLHKVKEIKFNHPVFTPSDDYILREGSLAIVVQCKEGTSENVAGG